MHRCGQMQNRPYVSESVRPSVRARGIRKPEMTSADSSAGSASLLPIVSPRRGIPPRISPGWDEGVGGREGREG